LWQHGAEGAAGGSTERRTEREGPAESPQEGGRPHSRAKRAPWGTPAVGRTGGAAVQVHRTASHERSPALRGDAA